MNPRRAIATLLVLLGCAAAAGAQAPVQQAPESSYDPYHAEKSIEVGLYYFKKGNYDAAIDRFQDAVRFKPNFARAYHLLGEAYEKKGDKAEAVQAYRKYLEILPAADDAKKVRKRIDKLTRELDRAAKRRSG
jgi:Tfp pilus assembly protein PilF